MAVRTGAVILAAGASERMGTPKALLPWNGTTLLEFELEQARAAGVDEIVVVLGPATAHVLLPGIIRAFNPKPETGRSESIRIGCSAISNDVSGIVIQSVDQPTTVEVVRALLAALAGGDREIAVPTYQGRRGHPICLAGRLLPELRAVTEEAEGLRSVVHRHAEQLCEVPVHTGSVLWNLNDPAAYAAAQANAG